MEHKRVSLLIDHEPAYTPPPPPPHPPGTQFRLAASELLLFVSVVLVVINALYVFP